ncbi:MAG TPA: thiamine pyrophosphate-binding protein [Gemmataceae bacterium]|nr:thiamine pyrophosphate-binding protein [Gemmataceae bacterium]
MTGIEAFLDLLASAGVRYLFGNPGTTELPLNDALACDPRFKYVLALHEVPVMAMADGYALASRSLGVVNVHIGCGLGNAMGMLYNAHCERTPLLVTAGQQDRRLRMEDPVLSADLVSVARPWTKWAYEVTRVQDLPTVVRRAVQTALSPPTGPVFLALPVDLQMEACDGLDMTLPRVADRRTRPPREALQQAAALLAQARNPVILAGSRVADGGAIAELTAIAELLGATVFSESATGHGRLPMAPNHPLYAGALPLWSPDARNRLDGFDVAFATGTNLLKSYIYLEPQRALPEHLKLVQLDEDPWQLGKTFPLEVGLIGDTQAGLAELERHLREALPPRYADAARLRREQCSRQHQAARSELTSRIEAEKAGRPMTSLTMMAALARVLPPNAAVVEEATTTTNGVFERLGVLHDPAAYFGHRGWALGWGLGCAMGVKLAWPDRPVLAILGDGATLFGIQGLWSAAHHRIPVTFVVANNRQYKILKNCGNVMPLPQMAAGNYVGMDLTDPAIDFVALAKSLGVAAERVENPDALSERVRESFRADKPLLLEVPIA